MATGAPERPTIMKAREQLHRPSDASPEAAPIAVDRRRTTNDPGDPVGSRNGRAEASFSSEAVYALGGGTGLLALAVLMYAVAARLGLEGLAVQGTQFAGVFLAGALGTGVTRHLAFNPR
jgi:hypothetical protein